MAIKIKLDMNPFDDIKVIAINTAAMDYQLASYLNKVSPPKKSRMVRLSRLMRW